MRRKIKRKSRAPAIAWECGAGGAKEGGGRIAVEEEIKRREGKEHESTLTCSARVNDYGEELQRELGYSIGKEGLGSLESPFGFYSDPHSAKGVWSWA